MARLDSVKESIGYLKLWLSILVVTGIGLISWFLSNLHEAPAYFLIASVIGMVAIAVGCFGLHKRIEAAISQLEQL